MGTLTKEYFKEFSSGSVFIETGTYEGDTLATALDFGFRELHSIELHEKYYKFCKKRFSTNKNVNIWQGESPDCISSILQNINEQCTFWLDAHASGPIPGGKYGGSPLLQEISTIGKHNIKNHVIIIDDCRLFGSAEWSGLKKESVVDAILDINYKYRIKYIDGETPNDIMVARVI